MTRHHAPRRRDFPRRLAELLHEVRQAKPDARNSPCSNAATLAALGVPHAMIDGFDATADSARKIFQVDLTGYRSACGSSTEAG